MSRLNDFKGRLASGEVLFLQRYENSIDELYTHLLSDNLLITTFDQGRVEQIRRFIRNQNAVYSLFNNANKIFDSDQTVLSQNINNLEQMGLKVNNLPDQYGIVMCHIYQVTAERLKLFFVTYIDFSLLNIQEAHRRPLGTITSKLKVQYPNNDFVNYLSTEIRNAVAHYTYYFQNGKVELCDGYFDTNPTIMSISDFMIEYKNFNILTEAFKLIFLDRLRPGGTLRMEEL